MTNIVFDTQNLFFRSTFTVGGYGKSNYTFDSQTELDQLMRKVSMDISSIIRIVNPNRIIFTLDSTSWRKSISIDENEGYKGNRKESEFINWNNVYRVMNEFTQILEANNFIVTKIKNAEADDIMALWRDELLFNKGQHVIIVSGDEDIRQLVKTSNSEDGKKIFATVYNPFTQGKNATKKLFATKEFSEWLDDDEGPGDFFDRGIDVDKEDFKRILSEKAKLDIINGDEIALRKVFCGDDGDNVPAIYTWLEKNKKDEDKKIRITESKFIKIKNYVGFNEPLELLDSAKQANVFEQIIEICKHKPPFKIEERLDRQLKLVVLNRKLFPKQIVNDFDEKLKQDYEKPNQRPQSINMNSILEGTRYVDNKNRGTTSSIFQQIDRISSKELF